MLSRLSISRKLWLLTLSIVIIFVSSFYLYFNYTVEQQFQEGFQKKGFALVQTASFNLGPGLYFSDNKFFSEILKGLQNDPDVSIIIIRDTNKIIKYEYGQKEIIEEMSSFHDTGQLTSYVQNRLFIKQSIFYQDIYQGEVIVGFDLKWIQMKMGEQKRNLILLSIILAVILIFLASILAKTISTPLKEAADTIKDYTDKDGALKLRLPVKGNDEIAYLVRALNHLADNLDSNILELNRSKKYLETIFQLNPVPIIIADTLGQIDEANDTACSFFGIEHDLIIQMKLDSFVQKEDLETIFNRIIQEKEDIRGYVTTLKMTDGPTRVVELNVASYLDENDFVKNVIIAAIDITEKIQIQREILRNQSKLQGINQELTQKTGELEKLTSLTKKNASNLAKLINITQQMMRSTKTSDILKTMLENSRELMEADECILFLHDKTSDSLKPYLTFPREIFKQLAQDIPSSDNFIWKTFRENDPVVIDSQKLDMKDIKILGLTKKDTYELVSLPISEKDYHFGVLVLLRQKRQRFRVEEVHLLNTLTTQTAILLDNKNLVQALEEKAFSLESAYEELQRSQQQVIQLQKMESLGTLVGGIAHDFNNILGIILPNTDLIKNESNVSASISKRVNIIVEATQRAAELTKQLLMFSRNQDIQLQFISPNQLVVRLSEMFQRTLGKEYDILLDLDPAVEDIEGDENRLTQVLINLALNARDSMGEGGDITIHTRMRKYKSKTENKSIEMEYVCISMTDSGCGIKTSDLDKIFDPFFTTKSVGKGTGLGLSVVYGIMQSHRGFVDVESELGEGTTFYLYFPPSRKKIGPDPENGDNKVPEGSESILIVDDEKMIRESVKDILEALGYTVYEASSGMEALKFVKEQNYKFDLAIVDMSMPKINGVETIRQLSKLDNSIKFLLSSGHLEKEKMIPDDLQIDGILPKPYRLRELALKIRQVLNQ